VRVSLFEKNHFELTNAVCKMNAKARVAASLESQNHKPSASADEFHPKVQAAAIHLSHQSDPTLDRL
jgi:hypothetical protein